MSSWFLLRIALLAGITPAAAAQSVDDTMPLGGEGATRVVVIGSEMTVAGLDARIYDLLRARTAPTIVRGDSFDASQVFREDADSGEAVTVWITVDVGTARVYVSDRARQRFVFRSLAVASPLTEVDRERVGQVSRTAVETVLEGGVGLLGRGDAAAQMSLPASLSEPTAVSMPAPTIVPAPAPTEVRARPIRVPASLPAVGAPSRWALAGLYEVQVAGRMILQAVGVTGGYVWKAPMQPSVWLVLRYQLPSSYQDSLANIDTRGESLRAGFAVSAGRGLRLGIGLGADHITTHIAASGFTPTPDVYEGSDWGLVGRLFARLGPATFGGVSVSATVLLEFATGADQYGFVGHVFYDNPLNAYPFRPGVGVELWWP
ncbi:MAG TPA: hypothetical protein VFH73_14615 [Polyangia bacterium]|nr:hypothetical protein [Polyangia bacterium]